MAVKQKIVAVTWRDSRLHRTQVSLDEIHDGPCVILSVGIVVRRNKDSLTIAMERIEDDWRGVVIIPNECIVKVKTL